MPWKGEGGVVADPARCGDLNALVAENLRTHQSAGRPPAGARTVAAAVLLFLRLPIVRPKFSKSTTAGDPTEILDVDVEQITWRVAVTKGAKVPPKPETTEASVAYRW